MSTVPFDPKNPSLSPATLELLLRLDGLTARLERAVVILEHTVGSDESDSPTESGDGGT